MRIPLREWWRLRPDGANRDEWERDQRRFEVADPEPIAASRRDFLKMLGVGAAALAAAPAIRVVEMLGPVPEASAEAFLPPNVLHLRASGGWRAVAGVRYVQMIQDPVYFDDGLVGRHSPRLPPSRIDREIAAELMGTCDGAELLHSTFCDQPSDQRWAISLSGARYEFGGFLSSIEHRIDGPSPLIDLRCRLSGIGNIEMSLA